MRSRRGVVPDALDPEVARLVGAAFARVVGASVEAGVTVGESVYPAGEIHKDEFQYWRKFDREVKGRR